MYLEKIRINYFDLIKLSTINRYSGLETMVTHIINFKPLVMLFPI